MQQSCCRGLVLEGVPGTGKSTIIRAMRELPGFRRRSQLSTLIIAEELTQRVLEPAWNRGDLLPEHHRDHLMGILEPMVRFDALLRSRGWSGSPDQHFLFLLERFHLTHVTYYPHLSWDDVQEVDGLLHSLDARLLILTCEAPVLRERILGRPSPAWRRYMSRYGETDDEIVEHYLQQQRALMEMSSRSRLSCKVMDVTHRGEREIAGEAWGHLVEDSENDTG